MILEEGNTYSAVQVKYRYHNKYKSKNVLSWKQLSTFYSWVHRTGPYKKHIIFTNADYTRHVGIKDPKDKSICIGTLRKIKHDHWCVTGDFGEKLSKDSLNPVNKKTRKLSQEKMRGPIKNFRKTRELKIS